MNLNRKALSHLLTLNDEELTNVLKKLAKESGVDTSKLVISSADIANIRKTLSIADDEEIMRLIGQFKSRNK